MARLVTATELDQLLRTFCHRCAWLFSPEWCCNNCAIRAAHKARTKKPYKNKR